MNMSAITSERASAILNDGRWAAVISRDAEADGSFYYSVASTGVYCRPSCGARLPRPENVMFHGTRKEAEAAGFRPCKRCKPDAPRLNEPHTAKIVAACRFIDESPEIPDLHQLAVRAGLSTFHFHRLFKSTTGLTPRGFAAACKAKRLRHELTKSSTVTEAIYDAGYNSNSRFYEVSNELLG